MTAADLYISGCGAFARSLPIEPTQIEQITFHLGAVLAVSEQRTDYSTVSHLWISDMNRTVAVTSDVALYLAGCAAHGLRHGARRLGLSQLVQSTPPQHSPLQDLIDAAESDFGDRSRAGRAVLTASAQHDPAANGIPHIQLRSTRLGPQFAAAVQVFRGWFPVAIIAAILLPTYWIGGQYIPFGRRVVDVVVLPFALFISIAIARRLIDGGRLVLGTRHVRNQTYANLVLSIKGAKFRYAIERIALLNLTLVALGLYSGSSILIVLGTTASALAISFPVLGLVGLAISAALQGSFAVVYLVEALAIWVILIRRLRSNSIYSLLLSNPPRGAGKTIKRIVENHSTDQIPSLLKRIEESDPDPQVVAWARYVGVARQIEAGEYASAYNSLQSIEQAGLEGELPFDRTIHLAFLSRALVELGSFERAADLMMEDDAIDFQRIELPVVQSAIQMQATSLAAVVVGFEGGAHATGFVDVFATVGGASPTSNPLGPIHALRTVLLLAGTNLGPSDRQLRAAYRSAYLAPARLVISWAPLGRWLGSEASELALITCLMTDRDAEVTESALRRVGVLEPRWATACKLPVVHSIRVAQAVGMHSPASEVGILRDLLSAAERERVMLGEEAMRSSWVASRDLILAALCKASIALGRHDIVCSCIEQSRFQFLTGSEGSTGQYNVVAANGATCVRSDVLLVPGVNVGELDMSILFGDGAGWLGFAEFGATLAWGFLSSTACFAGVLEPSEMSSLGDALTVLSALQPEQLPGESQARAVRRSLAASADEWRGALKDLGRSLFPAEMTSWIDNQIAHLYVSPCELIAKVPLSLCLLEGRPLLERVTLSWLPELSSAAYRIQRTSFGGTSQLRIAVIDPGGDSAPLVDSLRIVEDPEGKRLQARQNVVVLGRGPGAQLPAKIPLVLAALETAPPNSIAYFSCHGHEGEQGLPTTASIQLQDGYLTAGELARVRVSVEGCILSVCSAADVTAKEWTTIAPALLRAGCKWVVASTLPVLGVPPTTEFELQLVRLVERGMQPHDGLAELQLMAFDEATNGLDFLIASTYVVMGVAARGTS